MHGPMSRCVHGPVFRCIRGPVFRCVRGPVFRCICGPLSRRIGGPLSRCIRRPVSRRIRGPLSRRISGPTSKCICGPVSSGAPSVQTLPAGPFYTLKGECGDPRKAGPGARESLRGWGPVESCGQRWLSDRVGTILGSVPPTGVPPRLNVGEPEPQCVQRG